MAIQQHFEVIEPTPRDWEQFYAGLGSMGIIAKDPKEEEWPGDEGPWPGDEGPWPDENEPDPRGGR